MSPVRSATGADDDPSSRRRPFHSPSRSHVQPPPLPVPRSATALRKRPRTDVRSAWSPASSESRLNRPAFSFDQFSVLATCSEPVKPEDVIDLQGSLEDEAHRLVAEHRKAYGPCYAVPADLDAAVRDHQAWRRLRKVGLCARLTGEG